MWLESYSALIYYIGFALFPFVLFLVYFDLSFYQFDYNRLNYSDFHQNVDVF